MKDKIKVLGFMTLHYGKEYLKESLLSVRDYVDRMVIAYTEFPSHGHYTNVACPETKDELKLVAESVLGDKLIWEEGQYSRENQHRGVKYKYTEGYDLCLTVDADEVFKEDEIQAALEFAYKNPERYYGIDGYKNFWRSFNHICLDGFRPIRIENMHNHNTVQNLNCKLTIYHFSTCQREEIMRYKYLVFGHASEIKAGWLDNVYYRWAPENNFNDLHPVSIGLWNAVEFDKNTLPQYLKEHENFNKGLV